MEVVTGTQYTLSFWAKGDADQRIAVWVQEQEMPWDNRIHFGAVPLTDEWKRYELPGLAVSGDTDARLYFGLGESPGTTWLDDVSLQMGSRDVWRRDYEGGVVLVNATSEPRVIDLGGVYQKIDGVQDPATNDGSQVTSVTLAPYDGLILLRIQR